MGVIVRNPELDEIIVEGLSEGTPLRQLAREHGFSKSAYYRWLESDQEWAGRIARARIEGAHAIAEEGLEIVDDVDEDPASRRVRADYRLKLLAKWFPKEYGDKTLLGSDPSNPLPAGLTVVFRKSDDGSPATD